MKLEAMRTNANVTIGDTIEVVLKNGTKNLMGIYNGIADGFLSIKDPLVAGIAPVPGGPEGNMALRVFLLPLAIYALDDVIEVVEEEVLFFGKVTNDEGVNSYTSQLTSIKKMKSPLIVDAANATQRPGSIIDLSSVRK